MKIILNGKEKSVSENALLYDIVNMFFKTKKHFIVELNGKILAEEEFDKKNLSEGDKVEIIGFVGGG